MILRTFGIDLAITAIAVVCTAVFAGPNTALLLAILAVLEISLSFDNAVINATVLRRMNEFWQRIFLTVGVLIAVFGMRLIFPVVVVMLTGHLGFEKVFDLAVNHPHEYSERLTAAHPAIAAFGGIFLLMIFLDFLFDQEREIQWLGFIERPLARAGRLDALSSVIALVALLVVGEKFSGSHTQQVLTAGVAGLATYLAVGGLGDLFESQSDDDEDEAEEPQTTSGPSPGVVEPAAAGAAAAAPVKRNNALAYGKAAFFLFLYLEVLDASFSFDGVVGAFAITQKIFLIAGGLGIGALYIRSLTVYLVRKGTLQEYVYLEHGAHYAIGALAIILGISIETDVPEVVTGLIGVAFIGVALISSLRRRKRIAEEEGDPPSDPEPAVPASAKI